MLIFFIPFAKELRAYVNGLGKPIDRVIITHGHPDHWFGLDAFKGARVTSLSEVAGFIEKVGPMLIKKYKAGPIKDLVPDVPVVPDGMLAEGKETIDGVKYVFKRVKDAEADSQLLTTLPDYGVMIAQDLVYNKVHLFVGADEVAGWKKVVGELKKKAGIKTVLCGHGKPAGPAVFDEMLKYLDVADKAVADAKKGAMT
jgi:glyoxylase-like metal-dependent hydrolase (beta-lactamase superfamily II)